MMLNVDAYFQTSPAIIAKPVLDDERKNLSVGIYEFFTKSFAFCPIETMHWLSYFQTSHSLAEAVRDHPQYSRNSIEADIEGLVGANFLLNTDSEVARQCDHYRKKWEWDITTAAFHFTVLNNNFSAPTETIDYQLARLDHQDQPEYFWKCSSPKKIALNESCLVEGADTLALLAKRRTVRTGSGLNIGLDELSSCLFASFGIIGQVKSTTGYMPLTMTPSGGARNPYEAYIIVKRCSGLTPGVYRYSAIEHALEQVQAIDADESLSHLFAGQDWLDEMAVVVVMVAVFERTMWKYQDPNAYRVVLIEAGHKAQNFMIMATRLGMTACPTAALAHDALSDLLLLEDKMMHVPVYAFSLDKAMPNQDEIIFGATFAKLQSQTQPHALHSV